MTEAGCDQRRIGGEHVRAGHDPAHRIAERIEVPKTFPARRAADGRWRLARGLAEAGGDLLDLRTEPDRIMDLGGLDQDGRDP
jgi:hypothetical protein